MQALSVSIMLGSLSNDSTDFTIASTALANTTAKGFFSVIGAQWNTLDKARLDGLGSGLPYWGSEHKCGNYPWNPQGYPSYSQTPPNDQAYAVESWGYIRDAIKTVGVTSYNAWNMVLDSTGLGNDTTRHWAQNSLLVGNNDGTVARTPTYYVFRHFSQYVQPGAKVLSTTGGDRRVQEPRRQHRGRHVQQRRGQPQLWCLSSPGPCIAKAIAVGRPNKCCAPGSPGAA